MNLVVYAIAKNEERFVKRFMDSVLGANDVIVGVDVTSTDNTKGLLLSLGAKVIDIDINPWNFSEGRNAVLKHVPKDSIAVSIDLDEVFNRGWVKSILSKWKKDTSKMTYKFIYSWLDPEQTVPHTMTKGFKIHASGLYKWENPVHEFLTFIGTGTENIIHNNNICLSHYPDLEKERPYKEIIQNSIDVDPSKAWNYYLLAREFMNKDKNYAEAMKNASRYLELSKPYGTDYECECRSEMCRIMAISTFFIDNRKIPEVRLWMIRAVGESPNQRENWVYLAESWLMGVPNYSSAYSCYMNAVSIDNRDMFTEFEERCWDDVNIMKIMTSINALMKEETMRFNKRR